MSEAKVSTVETRVQEFLDGWLRAHPNAAEALERLGADATAHAVYGAHLDESGELTVQDVMHLLESHRVLMAIKERVDTWKYYGQRFDLSDAVDALTRVDELCGKRGDAL
jgi:hypothetical protein